MIFVITIPKSGTGLMWQMMPAIGQNRGHFAMFAGPCADGKRRQDEEVVNWIKKRAGMGGFATGHFHFTPEIRQAMGDAKIIFLYRDPRDIVISHVHYVLEHEDHPFHEQYEVASRFSFCQCVKMSILGNNDGWRNVGERLLPYLPWYFDPTIYVVKYKHLMERRYFELSMLATHLGVASKKEAMIDRIKPQGSTFRAGRVGDYRLDMSEANQDLMRRVANWAVELWGNDD